MGSNPLCDPSGPTAIILSKITRVPAETVFIADFAELDIGCIPLVFFFCFLEEKVIQVWFDYFHLQSNQTWITATILRNRFVLITSCRTCVERERKRARERERYFGALACTRRGVERERERASERAEREREQKRESKSEGASEREREDVLRGDQRKEHGKHSYAEAPAMAIQAWELLYLYMHKRMRNRLLVQLGVSLGWLSHEIISDVLSFTVFHKISQKADIKCDVSNRIRAKNLLAHPIPSSQPDDLI